MRTLKAIEDRLYTQLKITLKKIVYS